MNAHPHWTEVLVPILFGVALVVCATSFVCLLNTLIHFIAPFV